MPITRRLEYRLPRHAICAASRKLHVSSLFLRKPLKALNVSRMIQKSCAKRLVELEMQHLVVELDHRRPQLRNRQQITEGTGGPRLDSPDSVLGRPCRPVDKAPRLFERPFQSSKRRP